MTEVMQNQGMSDTEPDVASNSGRYRWGFIEFKVDILALLAFMISLTVGTYQVYWFFKGSDVSVLPPEQVMLRPWLDSQGTPQDVHLFSRLTVINLAPAQHPDTVLRAKVGVRVGQNNFTHHWQHVVSTKPGQSDWLNVEKDAAPFVVGGRASTSQEIWFRPRVIDCEARASDCDPRSNWVQWSTFLGWLDAASEIRVLIAVELASGVRKEAECRIPINEIFLETIRTKNWHAPPCLEPQG